MQIEAEKQQVELQWHLEQKQGPVKQIVEQIKANLWKAFKIKEVFPWQQKYVK